MSRKSKRNALLVKGEQTEILAEFPVLWGGWEMDQKGWIVRRQSSGKTALVLTNHGTPYFANKKEIQGKLDQYKEAVDKTERALQLLGSW